MHFVILNIILLSSQNEALQIKLTLSAHASHPHLVLQRLTSHSQSCLRNLVIIFCIDLLDNRRPLARSLLKKGYDLILHWVFLKRRAAVGSSGLHNKITPAFSREISIRLFDWYSLGLILWFFYGFLLDFIIMVVLGVNLGVKRLMILFSGDERLHFERRFFLKLFRWALDGRLDPVGSDKGLWFSLFRTLLRWLICVFLPLLERELSGSLLIWLLFKFSVRIVGGTFVIFFWYFLGVLNKIGVFFGLGVLFDWIDQ